MDYPMIVEKIENFLNKKLDETGAEGFVIGVSGGLDSAVTAKLAVEAVGSDKVFGWVMPGDPSNPKNIDDAQDLCKNLGLNYRKVDIEPTIQKFVDSTPFNPKKETRGNLRARVRMVYEYIDANENNLLVLGTGNKSEIKIGYFTKYGDGAVDLNPLADLYKTEVKELAAYIGLDPKFVQKQPTAGLWENQSDEGELKATYEKIDSILKKLLEEELSVNEICEKTEIKKSEVLRVQKMYEKSDHKRTMPPFPELRQFD